MTAQVHSSDTGMVTLGMSVAAASRRNRKTTSTTRAMLIAIVPCTPVTEARMVWVRSPRTCILIEGGSERCSPGKASFTSCTVCVDVVSRLLVHVDDHGPLLAEPSRLADILDAVDGLADIADMHRRAIVIGDDDRVERRGIEKLIGRVEGQRLPGPVERALGGIDRRACRAPRGCPRG